MRPNLTEKQITRILDEHSIPYIVRDGRVLADSMEAGTEVFENLDDVTGWTIKKLRYWLGY